MKAIILAAIVIALEVGFVASVAVLPAPPAQPQEEVQVVTGHPAPPAPTSLPAARS
jgi:hypothetical protein